VTGAQPLFQGFREFAGLHQTKSLIRASQHDRRQAERQLWVDVASAFLGVLSLEKDLANVQTEISLYGDRVGELERYRKIGRSRPSEVLTVQSAQALLKAQADQLQGVIRVNRDVLAFLTGFEWNVPLTNAGAAPEAPKPIESYLADLERRPDVLGDTEREEAAQSGITIARGGHYPTIAAGGDYFFKRYGSLSDVNWDVSVALVMPIFNGGITQSQVDFARSQQRQAAFQVSRTKRLAEQEIRSLYDTLAADREQLESLRIANSLAEKSYRADLGEYRRGLVTNLDVLQAMQAFQESGRAMDRQVYQLSLDVEKLEAAVDRRPPRTADGSKTP
jgi:outer membrane protein